MLADPLHLLAILHQIDSRPIGHSKCQSHQRIPISDNTDKIEVNQHLIFDIIAQLISPTFPKNEVLIHQTRFYPLDYVVYRHYISKHIKDNTVPPPLSSSQKKKKHK